LLIEPVDRPEPPPLPGQRIEVYGRSWRVHLQPGDTGSQPVVIAAGSVSGTGEAAIDPSAVDPVLSELAERVVTAAGATDGPAQVAALARATAELLTDDLGAQPAGARAALALGRGDCTAHATLFAGLARTRGIAVQLVTGFRLDRDRLVRHRWALVHVAGAWMAVDPTYGEAPAAPRLLGLAVHDVWTADIAMADDAAFLGFTGARARR
jgi:transglutaminase-like putative cysteine protease